MKLFIITRKDLSPSQQAVQAGHALSEYLLHSPDRKWKNETLIYLGVKDLYELEKLLFKFDMKNIQYYKFHEPDLDNQITAIATDVENNYIKHLSLL